MVAVEILGDKVENEEYYGGEYIKDLFQKYFVNKKDIQGLILIKPNFRAPGEKREDIDIVVWMRFENFRESFATKYQYQETNNEGNRISSNKAVYPVFLNSFLLAIELKSHTSSGVRFKNTEIDVKYNGKYSSATMQSDEQRYSLINYIKNVSPRLNRSPFVNNLVWLRGLDNQTQEPFGCNVVNVLFGNFSFKKLIETIFTQNPPWKKQGSNTLSYTAYYDPSSTNKIDHELENVFLRYENYYYVKQGVLTRKKLEQLIQRELNEINKEVYENVGKQTTIIQGVPGSGKTINLLHLAYHLAKHKGKRCLILTFNRALNADINRLAFLAGFKDDPSAASVGTNTIMSLMMTLLTEWGEYEPALSEMKPKEQVDYFQINFINKYHEMLSSIVEQINQDVIDDKDISDLQNKLPELNWDIILVDESQDWYKEERDILFRIFGSLNFIVAYGSYQLIRQKQHLNWSENTTTGKPIILHRSYRQKINLCHFINAVSNELNLSRSITINQELTGGDVIVYLRPFSANDYNYHLKYCVNDCKNAPYDLLILANNDDEFIKVLKENQIPFHNGTLDKLKDKYPGDIDSSRLYNYRSCRGLEGWLVIANNFDVFLEKEFNWIKEPIEGLSLKETKEQHVANWIYMVLSRAIDRIVIILKSPNSKYSKLILQVIQNKDYGEIIHQQ